MAHFAEIENNIVQRVIVVNNKELLDENNQESEFLGIKFCEMLFGGKWIQTSYNANFRGKYAGIGDTYDEKENIFISPQPYPSWTRSGSHWNPPIPYPQDGKKYQWNESQKNWDAI